MGQRQSFPAEEPNRRLRVIRPNSRAQITRHDPTGRETIRRIHDQVPTMAFVPVNENQRRDERRRRRELIRERLNSGQEQEQADAQDSAAVALGGTQVIREETDQETTAILTTTEDATITPFGRMIAQVIAEAVIGSLRSSQRRQLSLHLSPETLNQIEPESTEDFFMRFLRLPVLVTSVGTTEPSTAVNADGETPSIDQEDTETSSIMLLNVFLFGQRSPGLHNIFHNHEESRGTRSSARIRERMERARRQAQWTVYIVSGNSVDNVMMMSDNPSYEELLNLGAMLGPARRQTVSQEAIDEYLPLNKYTQQVKQIIVGNSEKCQVCLNVFQSEEDVRILPCLHGFHKECIDEWLTHGQNKCPLCREQVIPPTTN